MEHQAKCHEEGCNHPALAKGLCSRHYQQDRRGRLGKARTYAKDGEAAEVKVATPRPLKARLIKQARRARLSLSEYCRSVLEQSLNAID